MSRPASTAIQVAKQRFRDAMATPEGQAETLAELADMVLTDGGTMTEIANAYGMSSGTFYLLLSEFPEVRDVLDDTRTERKMAEMERISERHQTEKETITYDKDGKVVGRVREIATIDGSVKACEFIVLNTRAIRTARDRVLRRKVQQRADAMDREMDALLTTNATVQVYDKRTDRTLTYSGGTRPAEQVIRDIEANKARDTLAEVERWEGLSDVEKAKEFRADAAELLNAAETVKDAEQASDMRNEAAELLELAKEYEADAERSKKGVSRYEQHKDRVPTILTQSEQAGSRDEGNNNTREAR